MTESERIAQIEAVQDVLTLYPADLLELILWTNDVMDADKRGVASPCAPRIFQEE